MVAMTSEIALRANCVFSKVDMKVVPVPVRSSM
jgi:hypothetical protein